MKRIIFIAFGFIICMGCNNEVKTYENKLDSAGIHLDSISNKIGTAVENTADSAEVRLRKLKDSMQAKGGRLTDSIRLKGGRLKDNMNKKHRDTTKR